MLRLSEPNPWAPPRIYRPVPDWKPAILGGVARNMHALEAGLVSHNGTGLGLFEQDIQGAAAEQALAWLLGLPWDATVGRLDARDVGGYEVRWVGRDDQKCTLKVRPKDKPTSCFCLVCGSIPRFWFAGWAYGADVIARGECKRGDRGPGDVRWELPATELNNPYRLPAL